VVSIEQLRVPLRIIERLKKAGIVEIEQLMGIDEFTLAKLIDVGVDRAKQIIKEAWFAYNPQVLGAEELFKKELEEDKIPTPFKSLNNWFGGGYPVGTLTEFYGIFGTGKTTMLMTSAVVAIKNGFSVLWIDTEKTFSTRRFLQIANARGVSEDEIKKHFKYILATSASELIMLFNVNFPLILKDYKEKGDEIKLITVDCIHPDTMIITNDGYIMSAKEIADKIIRNNNVSLIGTKEFDDVSKSDVISFGVKYHDKVYRIRTKHHEIVVSDNHRFFVFDGEKVIEKRASELKKGDRLVVLRRWSPKNPRKRISIGERFAELLGYFYGDGSINKYNEIRLHDSDKELLEHYGKILRNLGYDYTIRKNKNRNCYYLSVKNGRKNKKELADFILKHGFNDRTRLPEIIFRLRNRDVAAFIRGLFDAEGSMHVKVYKGYDRKVGAKTIKSYRTVKVAIHIAMKYRYMIEQLKLLLLSRFGIETSNICKVTNHIGSTYEIEILDNESIVNFSKYIGFNSKHKKDKLSEYFKSKKVHCFKMRNISFDSYVVGGLFRRIMKKLGISSYWFRTKLGVDIGAILKNEYGISVRNLKRIINAIKKKYGYCDELMWLERFINRYKTEIITDIKIEKSAVPFYDFTTSTSNYIASGILVHNSLTAPFRSDYAGISELQERQQQLNKVLRTLLRLGEIFKFATLYSNQVVAIPDRFDNYAPVGGHVVSHITNHIFKLRKSGKKRFLVAQDVPFMPQIEIEFKIAEKGVEEVLKE